MTNVFPDLALVGLLLSVAAGAELGRELDGYDQALCRRCIIVLAERGYLRIESSKEQRGPFGYLRNPRIVGITSDGERYLERFRSNASRSKDWHDDSELRRAI